MHGVGEGALAACTARRLVCTSRAPRTWPALAAPLAVDGSGPGTTRLVALAPNPTPQPLHTHSRTPCPCPFAAVFDVDNDKQRAAWEMEGSTDWQADGIDATNGFSFEVRGNPTRA